MGALQEQSVAQTDALPTPRAAAEKQRPNKLAVVSLPTLLTAPYFDHHLQDPNRRMRWQAEVLRRQQSVLEDISKEPDGQGHIDRLNTAASVSASIGASMGLARAEGDNGRDQMLAVSRTAILVGYVLPMPQDPQLHQQQLSETGMAITRRFRDLGMIIPDEMFGDSTTFTMALGFVKGAIKEGQAMAAQTQRKTASDAAVQRPMVA